MNKLRIIKEKIVNLPFNRKRFNKYCLKSRKEYLGNSEISIVAVNCIGAEIYHILGLKFNSPCINTSFDRKDFIRFCLNLKQYLSLEPVLECINNIWTMKLYSDELEPVYIKFPHDDNQETIISNWNKRKKRINYDKIFVICDDRGLTENDIREFGKINFENKIMLTAKKYNYDYICQLSKYKNKSCVGKYNVKKLNGLYGFQKSWDFIKFFNGIK